MLKEIMTQIKTSIILLLILTLLTGLLYPAIITGIAQLLFPWQANGSLIKHKNLIIGSVLIGQSFTEPKYFWGRASATSPFPYRADSSSGSNLGPSNPELISTVENRIQILKKADPDNRELIPVDLVTASGSGLDAEISPYAAYYQIHRIAKVRHLSENNIRQLIDNSITRRTFGILGEPRVNVLQLNLALDGLSIDKD